jgi:hypothetical protein
MALRKQSNQALEQGILHLNQSLQYAWSLLTNALPPTDHSCKFDWETLSCNPPCSCTLNYKPGDYSLDRACRLRSPKEAIADCATYHVEPSFLFKTVDKVRNRLVSLQAQVMSIAPPSDEDCRWNWQRLKCAPVDFCTLDVQWGDYSLTRSCRLRTDYVEEVDPKVRLGA